MSHVATNWAFAQRGLSPAAKLVLLTLADCHNPAEGCFPSQAYIANATEISRATVNRHLDALEARGLIRRHRGRDSTTHRQRPTRYLLAFEDRFNEPPGTPPNDPAPPAGGGPHGPAASARGAGAAPLPAGSPGARGWLRVVGSATPRAAACQGSEASGTAPQGAGAVSHAGGKAVSHSDAKPCLILAQSRVSKRDSNPVIEPVREPCVSGGASAAHTPDGFDRFWTLYPRPRDRVRCAELFGAALASGVPVEWILASAERYRGENTGNGRQYLAYADNWLANRRWEDYDRPAPTGADAGDTGGEPDPLLAAATFWAKKLRDGAFIPANGISAPVATAMRRHGLASDDDLRRAGLGG